MKLFRMETTKNLKNKALTPIFSNKFRKTHFGFSLFICVSFKARVNFIDGEIFTAIGEVNVRGELYKKLIAPPNLAIRVRIRRILEDLTAVNL